jgi:hypothetical protein
MMRLKPSGHYSDSVARFQRTVGRRSRSLRGRPRRTALRERLDRFSQGLQLGFLVQGDSHHVLQPREHAVATCMGRNRECGGSHIYSTLISIAQNTHSRVLVLRRVPPEDEAVTNGSVDNKPNPNETITSVSGCRWRRKRVSRISRSLGLPTAFIPGAASNTIRQRLQRRRTPGPLPRRGSSSSSTGTTKCGSACGDNDKASDQDGTKQGTIWRLCRR